MIRSFNVSTLSEGDAYSIGTHVYFGECGKLSCGGCGKRDLEIIFFHLPTACSDMAFFIGYKAYERIILGCRITWMDGDYEQQGTIISIWVTGLMTIWTIENTWVTLR
jgi:hypothetical protein